MYYHFLQCGFEIVSHCDRLINLWNNDIRVSFESMIDSEIIKSAEWLVFITIYTKNKVPKFNNILYYTELDYLQIKFVYNKIMFGIHIPILTDEIF